MHGIKWKLPTFGPPWLSERYHLRCDVRWLPVPRAVAAQWRGLYEQNEALLRKRKPDGGGGGAADADEGSCSGGGAPGGGRAAADAGGSGLGRARKRRK